MKKRVVYNLFAALIVGIVVFLAVAYGWFYSLNRSLQDSVYQRENKVDSAIKIIVIDEKTLEKLGQFENWTREPYARLIETLTKGTTAPKVIGIDVLFANTKGKEDALFVDACKRYPHVVLASNLVFTTQLYSQNGNLAADRLYIDSVEQPFDGLRAHTESGFANAVQDSRDGCIRYALLEQGGYRSFALQVAMTAGLSSDLSRVNDGSSGMFIDYTAPPHMYESFSMIDLLEGNIDPAIFDDSIVLVGASAAGMGDSYYTPINKGKSMYGVEIHANIVQGLLEGRRLTYVSPMLNGALCAFVAMLLTLIMLTGNVGVGVLLFVLTALGNYMTARALDQKGIVIDLLSLPAIIFVVFMITVAVKYIRERIHKHKVVSAFKKYVAPQVVEEIAKKGEYKIALGGTKRRIAVLFVDVRGFTPLSEKLDPEQVVAILNEFLGTVTQAAFQYGGTIDKFIGDAAMVLFNAPFDCEDYIYKAVMTAREIAKNTGDVFARLSQQYGYSLGCGIGVNCGDAVVGNIGCDFRMDYTAIGDTVNTAARLESNAEAGQILISGSVYEALKDRISAVPVEGITLKGKKEKIEVYSLSK